MQKLKRAAAMGAASWGIILALPASGALAADLPVKAPPPVSAPAVYSWTGFYVGGHVGYSAGEVEGERTTNFIAGANAGTADRASTERALNGVIGGGQIGWNWQTGPNWLFGFEADFQGSGQKSRNSSADQVINAGVVQTTVSESEDKLKWFGTVRLRTGYIVGNTLLYGTGGFAYGKVESSESIQRTPGVAGAAAFMGSGTVSDTKWGWTAGGGAETRLSGGWSTKIEYLFVDLGKLTSSYDTIFTSGALAGTVLANNTTTTKFRDHIFRVGLNYTFGGR